MIPSSKLVSLTPAKEKTVKICGSHLESIVTSSADSAHSLGDCDELVNSPARRNPKNPKQKAAQSITLSNDGGELDHNVCICVNRSGVIGRCCGRCWGVDVLLIPFKTYDSLGEVRNEGSGKPARIW